MTLKIFVLLTLLLASQLLPGPVMLRGLAGYEPLHMLFETAAITIAALIFAANWTTPFDRVNGNTAVIACLFAGVGWLDFSHMLSIQGMPDYVTPSSPEKGINFWLLARFMASAALLYGALTPWRPLKSSSTRYWVLAGVVVTTGLAHWVLLYLPHLLPRTFIPGQGLTSFKVGAEYTLIGLNLFTVVALLWRMRGRLNFDAASLVGVVATMAMGEYFFTLYGSVTDMYLVTGHIYKIISYLFLYQAVFVETVERPFRHVNELQDLLRSTLQAVPDLVCEVDLQGRYYQYHSPPGTGEDILPESYIGLTVNEVLPAQAAKVVLDAVQEAHQKGLSTGRQYALTTNQGQQWYELSVARRVALHSTSPRMIVLSRDITQRKQSEESILASQVQLQALLAGIPIPFFVKDAQSRFLVMNKACEDQWGRKLSDLFNTNGSLFFPPEQMAGFLAMDQKVFSDAQAVDYEEWVWSERYQENRRVHTFKNPTFDASGNPLYLVCATIDINEKNQFEQELKSSLHEKEALLKEVHHRVKNNLQVITSLLRLEGRRSVHPDTKAVLSDMQGRIRSMALLHESLYRSGIFASVDLASYLRKLTAQAFNAQLPLAGTVQLKTELAPVQVNMDLAVTCGLLVNELISNCLKHAFPDNRRGEITVGLVPAQGVYHWRLSVADSGIGMPANFDARAQTSLGLQLVSDLAKQMGATLEMDSTPEKGAEFAVTFKNADSPATPALSEGMPAATA